VVFDPQPGAVVVYAAGDGYSEFGHVGLVTEVYSNDSFLVREMNFTAWNQYDLRVSNRYDVEAWLLAPGTVPGLGGGSAEAGGGAGLPDVETAWTWAAGVLNDTLPGLSDQFNGFLSVLRSL